MKQEKNSKELSLQPDGVYKFQKLYLNYSFKKKNTKKLYFVFSGITVTPGANTMSYYSLRDSLDGSVMHVMDNLGEHGCYLLCLDGKKDIQEAVVSLVMDTMETLNIASEDVYFIGTSKGGTTAIAVALLLGFGNVIIGEPQIKLGDYYMAQETFKVVGNPYSSVVYAMTGRCDENDREMLNNLIPEIFEKKGKDFKGTFLVLSGDKYFELHVQYLVQYVNKYGVKNVEVKGLGDTTHAQIPELFLEEMKKYQEN